MIYLKNHLIIKTSLILLLVLMGSRAHAISKKAEWQVEKLGYEVWATLSEPKLRIPLVHSGAGIPYVLDWKKAPAGKTIYLLRYVAGELGTSEKLFEIRGAVIDMKKKRLIADEILGYSPTNAPGKLKGPQPEWTWGGSTLTVERMDSLKPVQIKLQ